MITAIMGLIILCLIAVIAIDAFEAPGRTESMDDLEEPDWW